MGTVVQHFALPLVFSFVLGCGVGWVTWEFGRRPAWYRSWAGWGAVLFLIGLVVAVLKLLADRAGFYLELALLFFAIYIAGCWFGGALRALFAPARQDLVAVQSAAVTAGGTDAATAGAASGAGRGSTVVSPVAAGSPAARTGASAGLAPAAPASVNGTVAGAKAQTPTKGDTVLAPQAHQNSGAGSAGTVPAALAGARPVALAAPLGGKADDLKLIRGIGTQNEEKLHGLGIYHFQQIADWKSENVEWAGEYLAFPGRIEREDWVSQAKRLAAGQETEFSKRVLSGDVPSSSSSTSGAQLGTEDDHPGDKPAGLAGPRGGRPDDLKRVSGIGRQNEERLNGLGIFHFDQIAAWSPSNVAWAGSFLAFPGRIEREKWVEQARQLAAGQETEFSRRVDSGDVPTSHDRGGDKS